MDIEARKQEILKIAHKTRLECEKLAENEPDQGSVDPKDLTGFCARASVLLKERLSGVGIESTFCFLKNGHFGCHVFLEVILDEKYYLDITATQFGGQRVMFEPRLKTSHGWWRTNTRLELGELEKITADWPDGQRPQFSV